MTKVFSINQNDRYVDAELKRKVGELKNICVTANKWVSTRFYVYTKVGSTSYSK